MDNHVSISWLYRSVVPSLWGWNTVDSDDLILRMRRNSLNASTANCGPLLEIILSGILNLQKTLSIRSCAVCSAVIVLLHWIRITPFICPWSTTDNIASKPLDLGRSVIKSIAIWAKDWWDLAPGIGIRAGRKERANLFHRLGCWPVHNALDLGWSHHNFVLFNNKPKVAESLKCSARTGTENTPKTQQPNHQSPTQ